MGYVKTVKTTRAQYASLLQSGTVDPDTLYYVNEGNGWDSQSLDTEGDIYLGAKPLTAKPTNPMDNTSGVFPVIVGSQGNTSDAWAATLDGLTSYYEGLKVVVYNNTGAASATSLTLNLNSLGARRVYRYGTTAISAIPSAAVALLTYVGTSASGKWVMDNYVNSTYDLAVNYMKLFGIRRSSVGVHAGSLFAFTVDGKVSSFKTTATGSNVTTQWFRLGLPVFHSPDAMTANTTSSATLTIRISDADVDIRNSMCSYNYRRFHSGRQTDLYMAVEVDAANGRYRPIKLTNTSNDYQSGAAASYADHIVTDLELAQGQCYLYLGARYSSGTSYYIAMLAADNPLYYYDGNNLIPFDIWRGNALTSAIGTLAKPLAVQETADWVPINLTNDCIEATGIHFDIGNGNGEAFNLGNFQPDDRFELSVGLTMANADKAPRQVLFKVDLMADREGVIDVVDHLASTMVSLPASENPYYASASLNILHRLTAEDVSRQRFLRIEAKEVSTRLGEIVRFYNCVEDFQGNRHQHASSYNIKVCRYQEQVFEQSQ
jgi:hypothetical protein